MNLGEHAPAKGVAAVRAFVFCVSAVTLRSPLSHGARTTREGPQTASKRSRPDSCQHASPQRELLLSAVCEHTKRAPPREFFFFFSSQHYHSHMEVTSNALTFMPGTLLGEGRCTSTICWLGHPRRHNKRAVGRNAGSDALRVKGEHSRAPSSSTETRLPHKET